MSLHHGSSRPFHMAIALPLGSSVSVVTTFASPASSAEPGSACEYPPRFGHVKTCNAAAARSHASAVFRSAADQIPPGPVRNMLAPAATVSARPSVPHGVVEPSGGPGERTIGNVGRPSNWIVLALSNVVRAGCAAPGMQASAAHVAAAATNPSFHRPGEIDSPTPFPSLSRQIILEIALLWRS